MNNSLIRKQIEQAGYNFAESFYVSWKEDKDSFVEDDQDEIWYKESSDENGNILKDVFEDIIYDRCCDVFYYIDTYPAFASFCNDYNMNIPDDTLREIGGLDGVCDIMILGIEKFIEDTYQNI